MTKNIKGRKFVATAATAALVASAIVPVASASTNFTDNSSIDEWAKPHVEALVKAGIMNGFPTGEFQPQGKLTKAEAATILAKALNLKIDESAKATFADAKDHWASEEIAALQAFNKEIITGNLDGTFTPDANVTREQFAKMAVTAFGLVADKDNVVTFSDVAADRWSAKFISTLSSLKVINGYNGAFNPEGELTRQEAAKIADLTIAASKEEEEEVVATKIVSVSAINSSKEIEVTFDGKPKDLTATDFEVSDGLFVVSVTPTTGNKAKVTFSTDMTDGAEYTISVLDAEGEVSSSTSFKYDLGDVDSIVLSKNVFEQGENVARFLKVYDSKATEIASADYNLVNVESSNLNVVDANGDVVGLGTSNLRFEIEYKDGSKTKSGFIRIDVDQAVTANVAGFELDSAASFENTVEYKAGAATAKTSLFLEEDVAGEYLWVYADDSKTNPEIAALDLSTAGDYTVTSKSPAVVSVSQDGNGVLLQPVAKGKANIEITGPNKYKKTVTVEVKEDPTYKDLLVGATSVKLSDESVDTGTEGVDNELVTLQYVDQYGTKHNFDFSNAVVNSANEIVVTDAIESGDKLVISTAATVNAFDLVGATTAGLELQANPGETVKNATIRVSYYKVATATKATTQKTISATVVDVNPTIPAYDYETLVSASAIDAGGRTTSSTVTVFAVDKAGNRIDDVTDEVTLTANESVGLAESTWFDFTTTANVVTFAADAKKYMTESGALKLNYTIDNASAPHGTVSIAYSNSFSAPNSAVVSATPVVIDTTSTTSPFNAGVTVEELLFGKLAASHLVVDTNSVVNTLTNTAAIAVKKGYTGYENTPVLSFLDKTGKAVVTGAGLYGFDSTLTAGNGFLVDATAGTFDANAVFEVEYSITNAKDLEQTATTANDLANALTIAPAAKQASFTLVITKITVANDPRVTDAGTAAPKNLLAAPKAVNVILK